MASSTPATPSTPQPTITAQNTDNNKLTLGTFPISKLLVQYSVPAIIANLATSLYNIIDSIFIGHGVGAMAIAGLAITFPLMNLVIAFCTLIAVGGATVSSIFLGQKNLSRATDVVNNVMLMCFVHAVVFGGLTLYFLDDILYFFGATEQTISYARDFMFIILLGTPISYVFLGLNNIMRATGYPKKAMISAFLSVGVNLVLAPIFIFHFKWGIEGAATATLIGQAVACVWVVAHFMNKNSVVHFDLRRRWFVPSLIKRMYGIGLSPFLMNCTACLVVVFLNKSLLEAAGAEGNDSVGAYGIINRTTMFFVMIVFGVTQGMQPILGYNFGANNWLRVKKTLYKGIWIGASISACGWVITELFPDAISSMFTTDQTMIDIAREGFRIYFICYPVVGAQIVIQNFFQSVGHPLPSIFLSLTRQLIFLLPFLWILPKYFGVDGVWLSMTGSDLLAAIVAAITVIIWIRIMNKRFKETGSIHKPITGATQPVNSQS
ncbi:MAG: MATE family efflux transporter [Muribaculaceae bacterium]|nr:MATE family efflux transporter [Muribaculaceae bacterium]